MFSPGIKVKSGHGLLGAGRDILCYFLFDVIGCFLREAPRRSYHWAKIKVLKYRRHLFVAVNFSLSCLFAYSAIQILPQAVYDGNPWPFVSCFMLQISFSIVSIWAACKIE
jgi:hypothetical protein